MIQRGNSPRFLQEATHAVVASEIVRQNLQSDLAIELGVLGQVDLTHSTRAELGADFIAANSCARVNCHAVILGESLSGLFSKRDHCRLLASAAPAIMIRSKGRLT